MKTRVLRTAAAVLTHVFEVDETPTDAAGAVTVTVTGPDGTQVTTGDATKAAEGTYTFALDGQQDLTVLSVAWSGTIAGADVVQTDEVEVVGGFFFGLREGRASDSSLSDTTKYPTASLITARLETEEEAEEICDRAFVPRYARVTLNGTGETDLILTHPDPERSVAHVRRIRSVSMAARADETFTDFSAAELAALKVGDDGTLRRLDGNRFTAGWGNVVVEYEYGLDGPPVELMRAAMIRFRSRLQLANSQIPDRASSFTSADGGTYRLTMPGAWSTGLPEVDAVYSRYSRRSGAGTGQGGRPVPAGRTLNYDPQYYSLFHLGRR